MTILSCRTVTKRFGSGASAVTALREVSLEVGGGEFTALSGPSGSGKTTLLNLAGGLDLPESGEVWLKGRCLSRLSSGERATVRRNEIGFIFQAYNLVPVLSAVENVSFIMELQGVPRREREARAKAVLERVGLGGMFHRRPGELSGGQQQRVAVARAVVSEPAIVLADEPTANLDSATARSLLDLMVELNTEAKVTFLFSTHDPRVMERARRVVRLTDGVIESDSGEAHQPMGAP